MKESVRRQESEADVAAAIVRTKNTSTPVEGPLQTDERVLARVTEGIYRQPASALRELVSNAYDADATEVIIQTDAPRFKELSVRDNGRGLTPQTIAYLVAHIGGSAKRTSEGKRLQITADTDASKSPGGRTLIGKLGIGLFSVAQFTRHFLLITKTAGDDFRTVVDITLRTSSDEENAESGFTTGSYRIWCEPATDIKSHGTEIKLLDLLPRTRGELASDDTWAKIDFEKEDPELVPSPSPVYHIGRLQKGGDAFLEKPCLPWVDDDKPSTRLQKLVDSLREVAVTSQTNVDLQLLLDNYLWTLWTLALSAPIPYLEGHPFDLVNDGSVRYFTLENKQRGQATEIDVPRGKSVRDILGLKTPNGPTGEAPFEVFMDGVQLFRPILYIDLPSSPSSRIGEKLMFVGRHREEFSGKPKQITDGPLEFESYLFWSSRIVPKQHQGVMLRVGNASGALFDNTFLDLEIAEITRKSQVTSEIFVIEGLDKAINIDRESFNYANIHYQFLSKWLHSAFRQLTNKQKDISRRLLNAARIERTGDAISRVNERVQDALKEFGVLEVPKVEILDRPDEKKAAFLRRQGNIVLDRTDLLRNIGAGRRTANQDSRNLLAEQKAIAIAQLLHGMGLLDNISYLNQQKLIRQIVEIILLDQM